MSGDKSLLIRFRSMQTGLVLVVAIIIASIAGTIIPQQDWTASAGTWYSWLQLNDVFHSWWYAGLLTLAAMNLMACSFYRLTTLLKRRGDKPLLSSGQIAQFQQQAGFSITANCSQICDNAIKLLKQRGYETWHDVQSGEGLIGAQHGRLSVWGSVITHFSFLVIMLGVLVGAIFGFQGSVNAPVGSVFGLDNIPGIGVAPGTTDFRLQVDDFHIERYADSTPSGYFTRVSILEDQAAPQNATIGVNQPLHYKGVKFYQASYGEAIEVLVTTADGRVLRSGLVMPGQRFTIPGTDYAVKATIPAAVAMDVEKDMASSSRQLAYAIFQGSTHSKTGITELNTPIIIGNQGYIVSLIKVVPYTGLLVKKDPGVPVIWLGSFFLLIGMGMSFFMRPHKLWLVLHQDGARLEVNVGGTASKNQAVLVESIEAISNDIKRLSELRTGDLTDKGVLLNGNV